MFGHQEAEHRQFSCQAKLVKPSCFQASQSRSHAVTPLFNTSFHCTRRDGWQHIAGNIAHHITVVEKQYRTFSKPNFSQACAQFSCFLQKFFDNSNSCDGSCCQKITTIWDLVRATACATEYNRPLILNNFVLNTNNQVVSC